MALNLNLDGNDHFALFLVLGLFFILLAVFIETQRFITGFIGALLVIAALLEKKIKYERENRGGGAFGIDRPMLPDPFD